MTASTVQFSVQSTKIWKDQGVDITRYVSDFSLTAPKSNNTLAINSTSSCSCFTNIPYKIFDLGKYICSRIAMTVLYPAQSNFNSLFNKEFRAPFLDKQRVIALQKLSQQGFNVYRVILEKDLLRCDGYIVSKPNSLASKKWILQVTGCSSPVETSIVDMATAYLADSDFSLLMVNGPSVGRSKSQATFISLAEAVDLSLCYLEKKVEAKSIALIAHSFGRALLGKAIIHHLFCSDIDYLVVSQMSFDKLSNIAKAKTGCSLTAVAIKSLGLDIDSSQSSEVLEKNRIHEVIIQSTKVAGIAKTDEDFATDSVIPEETCLGKKLIAHTWIHKSFVGLGPIGHGDAAIWETTIKIVKEYWKKKINLDRKDPQ